MPKSQRKDKFKKMETQTNKESVSDSDCEDGGTILDSNEGETTESEQVKCHQRRHYDGYQIP